MLLCVYKRKTKTGDNSMDRYLFNKFVYVGGIYSLIKANSFVREFIGGVSTNISQSVKSFANFKK